jgi:hypothetical protein
VLKAAGPDADLPAIARALCGQAVAGNAQGIREVADRLDGKVPQAIAGIDDDEKTVAKTRDKSIAITLRAGGWRSLVPVSRRHHSSWDRDAIRLIKNGVNSLFRDPERRGVHAIYSPCASPKLKSERSQPKNNI